MNTMAMTAISIARLTKVTVTMIVTDVLPPISLWCSLLPIMLGNTLAGDKVVSLEADLVVVNSHDETFCDVTLIFICASVVSIELVE